MLDYFFNRKFLKFDNDNEIVKTDICPALLKFEENKDGKIVFYVTFSNGQKLGVSEIEDWEFIEKFELNKTKDKAK